MDKDFISRSPCIQCGINGIEFNKNSLVCKKCKYFILVSVLGDILFKKAECDYCTQKPYGDNACTWCNFQLDIDKLLSEYRFEEESLDSDNGNYFSEEEPVKSFSEDEWEWLDIDAWLEEDDNDT